MSWLSNPFALALGRVPSIHRLAGRALLAVARRPLWRRLLLLAPVLLGSQPSLAGADIVLQIEWLDPSQRAGYDPALDQGDDRGETLDVRLLKLGTDRDIVAEVVSGGAQLGLGSREPLRSPWQPFDTDAGSEILPRDSAADRRHPRLALGLTAVTAALLWLFTWLVARRNRHLEAQLLQGERTRLALAESEALHRLLTENSGDVIWMLQLETGRLEYVSPSVERMRGFRPEELIGQSMDASLTPESVSRVRRIIAEHVERIFQGDLDARFATAEIDQPCKDGRVIKTEAVTSFLLDEAGRPTRLLGITRDISKRRALEAELRTRLAAVEAAGDAIVITDTRGHVLYANPVFTTQTGYDLEADKGMHTRKLKSGQHDKAFYEALWRTVLAGEVWRGEIINRRKNGELYEEEMTISPVKTEEGEIQCFVAVKRDVSDKRAMERALTAANERLKQNLEKISRLKAELAEQAVRDPLTGLYNRRYLHETLPRELARARHEGHTLTLAMMDVDHFKRINDSWGHPVGDQVLKALAGLLHARFREADMLCRFGGEEFLVLMPHIPPEIGLARVEALREDFAAQSLELGEVSVRATLSVGIASFPAHARMADALIGQADAALYRAKRAGRNRTEVASGETISESRQTDDVGP